MGKMVLFTSAFEAPRSVVPLVELTYAANVIQEQSPDRDHACNRSYSCIYFMLTL